jgi:type IV pilus assembly protein PilW
VCDDAAMRFKQTGMPANSRRQRGLSLVEIMIGLVLGLFLSGVFIQVFLSGRQTYGLTDALARLQESGRFAVEMLARNTRMAGYLGCGSGSALVANTLDGAGAWMFSDAPIHGYEGGVDTLPDEFAADVKANTDVVVVRRADVAKTYLVASHVPESATIHLTTNHDLKQGEILVISNADCSQIGIFQMSNVNNNDTIAVVAHNTGNATSPGNCTKALQGDSDCVTDAFVTAAYKDGSFLYRFGVEAYYISNTEPPTLSRRRLGRLGSNATTVAEELVEGIEDMQILYGENTNDSDGMRSADTYVSAAAVTDWNNVVSVRLGLLVRTLEDNLRPNADADTYALAGSNITMDGSDKRIRRVFTSVIALRNRAP